MVSFIEDNKRPRMKVWCSKFQKFIPPEDVRLNLGTGELHGSRSGGNVDHWHCVLSTDFRDSTGSIIYQGDILKADCYPFVSDGYLNYLGVVEYDPCDGWYYDLYAVSDRVRGSATGGSLSDILSHKNLTVVGNILKNSEMLEAV